MEFGAEEMAHPLKDRLTTNKYGIWVYISLGCTFSSISSKMETSVSVLLWGKTQYLHCP